MSEMNMVVTCKYCGRKEIYGRMVWLNGRCECRACYKAHYEELYKKPYQWTDLDWTKAEMKMVEEAEKHEV